VDTIITLTTDWSHSDNYAAIFKAHLYREYPAVKVMDISHDVRKNKITEAAFLIKTTYPYFPQQSVHIIDVNYLDPNSNQGIYRRTLKMKQSTDSLYFTHYLAFCYDNHYFLCENNGLVSLLCHPDAITEIVKIPIDQAYKHFHTFKAISYWIKAAVSLAKGEALSAIGEKYDKQHIELVKSKMAFVYPQQKNKIIFHGQYIDSYGNIITNLHKDFFDTVADRRIFFDFYCIQTGVKTRCKIAIEYNDKSGDSLLFLFGHSNYLELFSRYYAPFAKILNTELLETEFTITFSDNE
jgi:S-adenosylmethionine hydrolase